MEQLPTQKMILQPSSKWTVPSFDPQLHEQVASPAITPEKDCIKKLRGQIEDMKQLKVDNQKGHAERMDVMAKDNLKKKDACRAQYNAETAAQGHRNADSKAANAKKVSDLSLANKSKIDAQRIANEAEVVVIRQRNRQGSDEHDAWMKRLRTENKEKMAQMENDGEWKLSGIKRRGRMDELRREKELADNEATHNADMAAIKQKYEADLEATRQSREMNQTRHNQRMAAQGIQHRQETDAMELRQQNEVNALSRANEAKAEKEAANIAELKGKGQAKMDDMCRLMRRTDELEAQLEASTERFFVLGDKVEEEKAMMRTFEELQRLTATLLTAQMKIIGTLRKELEGVRDNYEAAENTMETEQSTLKALHKQFKAITAEQDRVRRRMSREIDALDKITNKLLEKYERALR